MLLCKVFTLIFRGVVLSRFFFEKRVSKNRSLLLQYSLQKTYNIHYEMYFQCKLNAPFTKTRYQKTGPSKLIIEKYIQLSDRKIDLIHLK